MIPFVCWLFTGHDFDRSRVVRYGPKHVQHLNRMLKRVGPYDLVCVTDQPEDVKAQCPGIEVIRMPDRVAAFPSYYPKLWAFSKEFGDKIGRRFCSIDLDTVIVTDPAPLLKRTEEFVVWDQAKLELYNTSFFLLDPNSRTQVWDGFTVQTAETARLGYRKWCGDQSWMAHILGEGEATFSEGDGLIQYRRTLHREKFPKGMIAAFLCGPYDPMTEDSPWIREYYG